MLVKRLAMLAVLAVSLVPQVFALPAREFTPRIRRVLQTAPANGTVTMHDVTLGGDQAVSIEIERMEVWAKDAKVIVYGADGQPTVLPPPNIRYFKGRVIGDDESAVFFSMSPDGSIRGMIVSGERKWTIGSGVRRGGGRAVERLSNDREDLAPILIAEVAPIDELTDDLSNWQCALDQSRDVRRAGVIQPNASSAAHKPVPDEGDVAGATYQVRLAIDTDNEFCSASGFSNNFTTITTYIGDLVGKANTVYERDLDTTFVLGTTNIRNGGAGTDPYTAVPNGSLAFNGVYTAIGEFGTYWHNNYSAGYPDPDGGGIATAGGGTSVQRSTAVMLSGKLFSAGVAWFDVMCDDNFFCGATGANCGLSELANKYGGAYAFNGSSGSVSTTVPDPEATVNGVQYGLPAGSNYWMLLEFLHEVGHNVGGPHTQCIALTAEEKTLYSTTRDFVDECYNRDGDGCYGGTTANCNLSNPGDPYCDAPPEKGTIMSYCHNIFSGGFRQSRYLFGQAGEPSFKVLGMFRTELEEATPDATITTQAQPVACSAGRTASVPTVTNCNSGCTFSWQITGGTITSSTTTSSITYTPTDDTVTLTVTILSSRGCGITASKTITTQCVDVLPPANVVAEATSTTVVNVSWTASAGAASYNVYRSTDGLTYSLAGNTALTSFNDTGRAVNTAHLYKVRAVNGGESADSTRDLATTVIFTDDPLVTSTTQVKAVHLTQLRTAIDAVRALAAVGAGSYTDTITATVTPVKAVHITEARTQLDAARSALSLSTNSYGETITATTTTIKASHFTELRNGVK